MSTQRKVLDVADLPEYAFGSNGLIWWGTTAFMVIEGASFAMLLVTYFFYRIKAPQWPASIPDLTLGTINVGVMLASVIPNHLSKLAAEKLDVPRSRFWMIVCFVLGLAFIVIRWYEFYYLRTRWDSNAYGSIVWVTLGTHLLQVITQAGETAVLIALLFTAHTEPQRLVDISENARYWYFVVLFSIPIYLIIYWGPRWL